MLRSVSSSSEVTDGKHLYIYLGDYKREESSRNEKIPGL